tara:strand:- start:19248 stop:20450 length:1203 start_codon:yes stop_codon:yes gene_type:complete
MKALFILITLLVSMVSMAFVTSDRTIATRADGANSVSDVINDHVNSLPNTAPTITLTGSSSVSYTVDATYSELGATCSDTEDGTITVPAPSFSPALDMATAATYTATYTCTDSGSLTDTVTRTVVVNEVGTGPTSTPNLFADGFESGDLTAGTASINTVNFAWEGGERTGIVYQDGATAHRVYPVIYVNSWTDGRDVTAKADTYSLSVEYAANISEGEQRFNFDDQNEIWLRYWIRVPENYTHGTVTGTNNNKFLALWFDTYLSSGGGTGSTVVWSMEEAANGTDTELAFTYTDESLITQPFLQQTPFIDSSTDQGRWMQMAIRVDFGTEGAADSTIQTYRRWENESTFTQLHSLTNASFTKGSATGWGGGYFMGWANGQYAENTWWLIDEVELSTESLL